MISMGKTCGEREAEVSEAKWIYDQYPHEKTSKTTDVASENSRETALMILTLQFFFDVWYIN